MLQVRWATAIVIIYLLYSVGYLIEVRTVPTSRTRAWLCPPLRVTHVALDASPASSRRNAPGCRSSFVYILSNQRTHISRPASLSN